MENQPIVLDKTLLTPEQRQDYDAWEKFFHGEDWTRLVNRAEPDINSLQNEYKKVRGEQNLGFIQGSLNVYYRIFVNLPDMINFEFLLLTGQVGNEEEDHSSDDPISPEDTSV